jgi:hypothetical protein
MNKKDWRALELALEQTLAENDVGRVAQVRDMLADASRTRFEVMRFCAFHRQMLTLKLKPWDCPPLYTFLDDGDPDNAPAVQLLRRMLRAGVSRFHPSPLEACQKAEAAWKCIGERAKT